MRQLLALAAVVLLTVGCGAPGRGTVVDGWELTDQAVFGPDPVCDRRAEYLDAGVAALADQEPAHAAIVEKWLFNQARQVARSGGPVLVAVFRLADGSMRAIGVGRVGIGGIVPFDAPDRPRLAGGTDPETGPCGPQPEP